MTETLTEADRPLRKGWTTGTCASAATCAALNALLSGEFLSVVSITLPKGQTPEFALYDSFLSQQSAMAAIEKDAGDDPDVTHGAIIRSTVSRNNGLGIRFLAGEGVGHVTKPGLPLAVGEPAINPIPRKIMSEIVKQISEQYDIAANFDIKISVDNGERLAKKTWNGRLGIIGGLSILGTTGIVRPFSCSAWIHSIHRGIDVARASGQPHVAGCTGATSERVVQAQHGLNQTDMLDMGDFVGGLLKYLNKNPLPRLTLGGGFGKFCKLAAGEFDLHSKRSQVNFSWLAKQVSEYPEGEKLQTQILQANTALEVLELCQKHQIPIAEKIAYLAQQQALTRLSGKTQIDVILINRKGDLLAQTQRSAQHG